MREYKIAKGWAIFIYIGAPLLIGVFGWLLIMPFVPNMKSTISPNAYWFLAPISIGMIGMMVFGLIDTIKGRFVIDHDKIYTIGTFSNRQLMFDEIKGYRVHKNYIFVEPNIQGKKRIEINAYFGKTNEIIEWLDSYYPNLDLLIAEQEEQEILSNDAFGSTEEQRIEKLNKARKVALILNWAGILVGLWTLFWPEPYEYAIIASISVPVISLVTIKIFGGLIRIDQRTGSAYPAIFGGLFFSSTLLFFRAFADYDISDYTNVWIPSVSTTFIFIAILLIGNKEFTFKRAKDYFSILVISIIIFGYSYGSVITLNCLYDQSEAEVFHAKILSKRISSGKSTTYYFTLAPWGHQKEPDEVSVSKRLYNKLDKGNDVNIYFKKGLFEIPWFTVTE